MHQTVVDTIKAMYPTPTCIPAVRAGTGLGYCCGGAFLAWLHGYELNAYTDFDRCFPYQSAVEEGLEAQTTTLTLEDVEYWAEVITTRNDAGDFEGAWDALAQALHGTHRPDASPFDSR